MTGTAVPPITPRGEEARYYERLAAHELTYQGCADCDAVIFPLRTVCPGCGSESLEDRVSSGRGSIHSFTTQHRAGHPLLVDRVPYTLVLVDLEEGFRVMADLPGTEPESVAVGQSVEAWFDDIDERLTVLRFRRAGEGS